MATISIGDLEGGDGSPGGANVLCLELQGRWGSSQSPLGLAKGCSRKEAGRGSEWAPACQSQEITSLAEVFASVKPRDFGEENWRETNT